MQELNIPKIMPISPESQAAAVKTFSVFQDLPSSTPYHHL